MKLIPLPNMKDFLEIYMYSIELFIRNHNPILHDCNYHMKKSNDIQSSIFSQLSTSGDTQPKLVREVNNMVSWLKDNRLCVAGDKSKLLIVGTSELRTARLTDQLAIEVYGQRIEETASEKLLGMVVNKRLSGPNFVLPIQVSLTKLKFD